MSALPASVYRGKRTYTSRSEKNASPAPDAKPESKAETQAAVAKLIAEGKKAIALRQWDEGVGKYADALDLQ